MALDNVLGGADITDGPRIASSLFVGNPLSLSPDYFNALFRDHGCNGIVSSLTATPIGTGQMAESIRYKFEFQGPRAGAPSSLVGKFPSPDQPTREMGILARNYEREGKFYAVFNDVVERLAPRPFHVDIAAGVVFLEDMAPAVQGDQIAGCDFAEAEQVIRAAAVLHAARWNSEEIEQMEWLQFSRAAAVTDSMQTLMRFWPDFEDRYRDRVTDEHMAIGRTFAGRLTEWFEGYTGPRTLTHGDFRLDNMMFGHSDAKPVAIVDWQTPAVRGPALDVSYFMGSSLTVETRRMHEDSLLDMYLRTLAAEGVVGYSADMLRQDYRWYAFHGLLVCFAGAIASRRTERGDTMFMSMYARHAQHVIDLDAIVLLGGGEG